MTITYRSVKDEALTYAEMDENFRDLREDTDLQRVLTNGNTSNLIINIEQINASYIIANNLNVVNSTVINETEIFVTSNTINANLIVTNTLTLRSANVEQSLNNSFTQANTARGVANDAYAQANTARNAANNILYLNYALYTANGTFTVPTGVTNVFAIVIGGGGGGSANNGTTGGEQGGYGGMGIGYVSVTPGQVMTIGVGAGGIGSTTGSATNGRSSNVGSLVATGGTGGSLGGIGSASSGTTTGGLNINNVDEISQYFTGSNNFYSDNEFVMLMYLTPPNFAGKNELMYIGPKSRTRNRGVGTANARYVSLSSIFTPGAAGQAELLPTDNNSAGGADGAVFIFY